MAYLARKMTAIWIVYLLHSLIIVIIIFLCIDGMILRSV